MNENKIKKLLTETFPNFIINDFTFLGKGKAGVLYLANNEIVFKVPSENVNAINDLRNESMVLKFLEGKLDIEIPKILYTATAENNLFIVGESLLSGTSFTYEIYDGFNKDIKNDILFQLGRIVRKLHDAGGNDFSWQVEHIQETPAIYINEFEHRLSVEVQNVFSYEEIDKIRKIAMQYMQISKKYPVKPVLCHFDLHFCNLMFDAQNKQITGLLDFGCAGYAEPARDLHYYFDVKQIIKGYGDNGDKYFIDRQKFHALSWLLNNLNDEIEQKKPYKSLEFIRSYIFQ